MLDESVWRQNIRIDLVKSVRVSCSSIGNRWRPKCGRNGSAQRCIERWFGVVSRLKENWPHSKLETAPHSE